MNTRKTIVVAFVELALILGGSRILPAQSPPAISFLDSVSTHPAGDEVERDRAGEIGTALNTASRLEVESVLPGILEHTRIGTESHARLYTLMFLLGIAMRPDGAELLSHNSDELSSLITDSDPAIQTTALAITDYLLANPATNKARYMAAMQTVVRRPETPQDLAEPIVEIFLTFGRNEPDNIKTALVFLQRDDLSASTRIALLSHLASVPGLRPEATHFLVKELDASDPAERAAAVAAFADSTSEFHALAEYRVEEMANDSQENPSVRSLAKAAIAGKTHLNPSIETPSQIRAVQ
jgi:hypothetical protein